MFDTVKRVLEERKKEVKIALDLAVERNDLDGLTDGYAKLAEVIIALGELNRPINGKPLTVKQTSPELQHFLAAFQTTVSPPPKKQSPGVAQQLEIDAKELGVKFEYDWRRKNNKYVMKFPGCRQRSYRSSDQARFLLNTYARFLARDIQYICDSGQPHRLPRARYFIPTAFQKEQLGLSAEEFNKSSSREQAMEQIEAYFDYLETKESAA